MDDQTKVQIRALALEQAIKSCGTGALPHDIVKAACQFYTYLTLGEVA